MLSLDEFQYKQCFCILTCLSCLQTRLVEFTNQNRKAKKALKGWEWT